MNAKYFILIAFSCLLGIFKVNAQVGSIDKTIPKFYFKGAIGAGMSMNGEFTSYQINGTNNNQNTITAFGNGAIAGLSLGYQLNSNIGFELGYSYLYGFKDIVVNQQHLMYYGNDLYIDGQAKIHQIIPSIVISAPTCKLRPYMKVGLNVGMASFYSEQGSTLINANYTNGAWADNKILYHGGHTIGTQSAIGCEIPLNSHKTSFFFEADFNNIIYLPGNRSVYAYTINGTDQFSTLQTSDKELVYRNEIYLYRNSTSSEQSAFLQVSIPLSGAYLKAGIKLNLGAKTLPDIDPQPGGYFYARLQAGDGLVTNADRYKTILLSPGLTYDDSVYESIVLFSGGEGLNAGMGIGYMFNSNFGVDIGVNYVNGTTKKYVVIPNTAGLGYDYGSYTGNMVQFVPSLVIASNLCGLQPYARLGLIFGSGTVTQVEDQYFQQYGITSHSVWKYMGGISLGYSSVLGIAKPINNKFDIFIEAAFNNIYDIPTTGNLTSATVNGVDNLNSVDVQDKSIVYKNSYSNADNYDTSKPKVVDPVKYSFCSAIVSIGARFKFGMHKNPK